MRIINIAKNAKRKTQNAKPQCKIKNFNFCFAIFTSYFLLLTLISGCVQKNDIEQAKKYAAQSEASYQQAIKIHQELIAKGQDLDKLHYQLGRLYYAHGEFDKAIAELKKTNLMPAKKFLAIACYRTGNFTDALEVFNKNEIADDEYLYYQGLTCEKLNLFDKALDIYRKIKGRQFAALAAGRINVIEKQVNLEDIKDIDPGVAQIIAAAPKAEQYPQAGALILSCRERIEITPENTQVAYLHYIVKIINERGKEDFSESHLEYDSTYEKVELEYARTIRPDGRVVEVGSRHIRDVSKYLNFPLYSNARVYIISFPEIAEGSVIEYKVKIYRNQLVNKKDFALSYPVQASEPIMKAGFKLEIPKARKLAVKTLNEKYNHFGADLKPRIKEDGGRLIYEWQFDNIPQIIPESSMPAGIEVNPTIIVSTFKSWQEIYQWWWDLAKDKIKADSAIKEKVKELTGKLDSAAARARAVYNFCARKIRYVAVEYGDAGYEPHKAEDVFRNKYGDCKDQAILLVTMLREAGLPSWPVLIPTKSNYNLDPEFPSMLFNHAIAAVQLEEGLVFLDPTAETCALGDLPGADQDRRVLVIKEDNYEIQNTPLYPAAHNLNKQCLKVEVSRGESINARKEVFTYGVYDQAQRYWLLYTAPELIEEALKQKIQEISIGAKLKDYRIKNLDDLNTPVALDYSFQGPEYFTSAGFLRIMPQLSFLDTSLVAKDRRNYPIDFNILESKETILEVAIPDNFKLKYIPQSIAQDNPWFKFSVEYSLKGSTIYFRQNTQLKKTQVTEAEYGEFKKLFEGLAKKVKQRVILEKKK
ncbi:DUF3857 domain-containing protein [bacterium]|nr:MAG: DUF3857 domain-containing protein [bacterium]